MSKQTRRKLRLARMGLGVSLLAVMLCAVSARARVEADPGNPYPVTPQAGAWMICVTSYTGDPLVKEDPVPLKLAHAFVIELRQRYGLPAYVYNRGAEERRKQEEAIEQRRQAQLQRMKMLGLKNDQPIRVPRVRVVDQCAVLVGGYDDIEDARRALDRIKKLDTPESDTPLLWLFGKNKGEKAEKGECTKNPFLTAFVVRNPTVPHEQDDVDHEADFKFLQQLNSGEKYSLLQCKKPWTLAVKEYRGTYVMQPKSAPTNFIKKLFSGDVGKGLDAGAQQAHEIARVMRENMQLEAYVLHTRRGSVVSVGGYESAEDPQLLQMQKTLGNLRFNQALQLMAIPLPMEVPHP